ncbi:MAG TPA: DNA internalization-related competence protein ComEC/Rec2, partial [Candidatus Kapabacteria bacterium]|nr:DNA internalization-related competence protein ComEC/Rec2 [Candidatus Kapabacteria bacterium]
IYLALGIWAANIFSVSKWIAAGAFAALAIIAFALREKRSDYIFPVLAVAIIAAGMALGTFSKPSFEISAKKFLPFENNTPHLFYVTCNDDPADYADGFSFRGILHAVRDSGSTLPLGDEQVVIRFTYDKADTAHRSVREGNHLLLFGKLHAISGVRNPGEFDFGEYLHLQSISARMSVYSALNLECIGRDSAFSPRMMIAGLRHLLANAFDKYVGGDEGNFLKGVLLGERSELPDDVKDAFINTGTFHVLAVSGLHVGFVLLILLGVLSPITNRYANWLLLIGSLVFYTFLAGAAPSIQRAALMAGLAATGRLFERKLDGLNIIGGAAFILLIVNPMQMFTAGFQLSFAAALGLVIFYPRLWILLSSLRITRVTFIRWMIQLFCVSLAAQLGTFPLTALYFEKLSIGGIAANLIVVPAAGVALGMAAMLAVVSPFAWLSFFIGDFARLFVHELLSLVQWLGNISFLYTDIPPFTIVQAIFFYCCAAFLFYAKDWTAVFKRATVVAVVIIAIIISPYSFQKKIFIPGAMTFVALDVGQGDGIVIHFPNGKTMVVDAGPLNEKQERNLPVAAFLRRQGIMHIDALVLTHLHSDHIGGAPELLRECVVDTIYHSGERIPGVLPRMLDSLSAVRHIATKRLYAGDVISLDTAVKIFVLHPDSIAVSPEGEPIGGNLNNGSVVLKIQYGVTSILLSGDLENERELSVAKRYGDFLHADILKTGHHGSITSTTPEYLEHISPHVAVISVGENMFGHPSQEVIERLHKDSIAVERTDEDGAIIWNSNGNQWEQVAWR